MTYEPVLQIIFALSLAALFYTYIGYPVLVYLISLVFPKPINRSESEPLVTVLITAFNEEESIAEKLENTLEIDYPSEKMDILVASDGSSDQTDKIVRRFADRGVRLFHQEGRKGKTYTQNKAVEQAKGEIILFSDATTEYRQDVLRELIPYFADESVGCAAGRLVYVDDSGSDVGKGARSYWSYETFLKRSESKVCSLIGASGCLYAVRKEAYRPMYPEACSDFLICTILYKQGLRSVYVPEAVCFEETNVDSSREFKMRVRVISQTFTDLWRNRSMMNPFKSGFYAVQLFSHKLLRYMVPVFLFSLFVSSVFLSLLNPVFAAVLAGQVLFYGLALIGWILEKSGFGGSPFSVFLYFVIANFASVVGFYKFMTGETYASWEPIRKDAENRA
ncbi:MAG: glycosyltransferase family 2 protein [Pyrinomonadaceae bacterium]|nr:glycosyltransferase family 2 protein [Pyrinomonadaceae bacterium]